MRKLLAFLLAAAAAAVAIAATLATDDFEDGTLENWQHPALAGLVTNQASGGPTGASDNYLRVVSNGGSGPGSRLAVVNRSQWAGDYGAIGGDIEITMDLANFGTGALAIRLGVEAPDATTARWISTSSFALPADSVWRTGVVFALGAADLTQVQGTLTHAQTMAAVQELRIISAASPSYMGDVGAATLGVDNIRITQVPVELQTFTIE